MTELDIASKTPPRSKRRRPVTSKATESASPIAASAHRPERRWFFCSTSRATSMRGIPPSSTPSPPIAL